LQQQQQQRQAIWHTDTTGMPPPHEVLGVSLDASPAVIRSAFFGEARRWHPDKRPAGESAQECEAARHRFVAIHSAYEALMSSASNAHASMLLGGTEAALNSTFSHGSQEAVEEARARRAEAEEYVRELRAELSSGREWLPEERYSLQAAWRGAFQALEALRMEEMAAQVTLDYKTTLQLDTGLGAPEKPAAKAAPLDGPRTMSDHFDGVAMAFEELYEDVCGAYFEAWRWSRWFGEFTGVAATEPEAEPEVKRG